MLSCRSKKLNVSANSLWDAYRAELMGYEIEKLTVEDLTIEDSFLAFFQGAKLDIFDMDEKTFTGTSLEDFNYSLLAIKKNTDDSEIFIKAISSYLQMAKNIIFH